MTSDALEARLAAVVGGVLRQALTESGAAGVSIVDDGTPEAALARRWALRELGELHVFARSRPDTLLADTANKTALLLSTQPAAAALAPLGDLYASQIERLAGGWHGEPAVRVLAELCGGVAALDRALLRWAERREPLAAALDDLPGAARAAVAEAVHAARFARSRAPLVPKLSARTLGIDLFA